VEYLGSLAEQGKIVVADVRSAAPAADVAKFRGIRLAMPSEREARMALHDGTTGPVQLGEQLLEKTGNGNLILVLGGEGLLVFERAFRPREGDQGEDMRTITEHLAPMPTIVRDPAGAREAMLATLGLSLASGADVFEAALLANAAAAVAVSLSAQQPVPAAELVSAARG
jgi:bifunctional ADP-heptose synthase (sugar kinase/adenylyltransferase)